MELGLVTPTLFQLICPRDLKAEIEQSLVCIYILVEGIPVQMYGETWFVDLQVCGFAGVWYIRLDAER